MHANDDEGAVELIDVDLALPAAAAVYRERPDPDRAHVRQGHGGRVGHALLQQDAIDSARQYDNERFLFPDQTRITSIGLTLLARGRVTLP